MCAAQQAQRMMIGIPAHATQMLLTLAFSCHWSRLCIPLVFQLAENPPKHYRVASGVVVQKHRLHRRESYNSKWSERKRRALTAYTKPNSLSCKGPPQADKATQAPTHPACATAGPRASSPAPTSGNGLKVFSAVHFHTLPP